VAAAPPTRVDMYGGTQRMGADPMMAGRTAAIPPVADYEYAGAGGGYGDGSSGRRSHKWIPWVLGLVLVLGVVIGVAYYLLGGGKTYSVPLVNNQTLASAERAITANGLRCCTVIYQANNSVGKGLVIDSNPPQGNNVAQNTLVTLYVSKGPEPVVVPNVEDKQENVAQTTLQNDGFQVQVQQDTTSTEPPGTVVNQSPVGGTSVAPGSKVTIFVSGGTPVPNVQGVPASSAVTLLQNTGFKVNQITTAGPAGTTPGDVWQQNPAASSPEPPGSTVTIYIQPAAATPSPSVSGPAPTPTPSGSAPGFGGGF
jgi:eukaryotic-like serine/threonine-protein kinase